MTTPPPLPSSAPSLLNYQGVDPAVKLWNPNAASCWCLLFSPIFGAWLVAANWDTLGFLDKAKENRTVAWVLLAIFLVTPLALLSPALSKFNTPLGLVLLIGWYLRFGKPQINYVKATLNNNYVRRSWGGPIAIAIGLVLGYFIYCFAIGVVLVFTGLVKT